MNNILKDEIITVLDTPNRNGRIYSSEEIAKMISERDSYFGTIGMPEKPFDSELEYSNLVIDLSRVSHEVFNLKIVDKNLIGDIRILNTYQGKLLKSLLDAIKMDFRLNGFGTVTECDTLEGSWISNYKIFSINAVQDGA